MIDLHEEINIQIERIHADENTELLELHYLFYDGYTQLTPEIDIINPYEK
jgi:hypothetical protein